MAKDRLEALEAMGFDPSSLPQVRDLRITNQTLKGFEVRLQIQGLTNVEDLGQLDPQVMTISLFEWLYRLHGSNYDAFAASCRRAVMIVKDADKAA